MKRYPVLLVTVLVLAGFFSFFYYFGHNDAKAIADFSGAYENYNKATSDFSTAVFSSNHESTTATDDLEHQADAALIELNTKASTRISSLTKNDADLMNIAHEIADLSGKEGVALKAYKSADPGKGIDLDKLVQEIKDLTDQRQTDYARFQELAGIKD